MKTSTMFDMNENGKNVNITKYRGMIGPLLYLNVSIPDIMFSVCICAYLHACPKKSTIFFLYLHGTINLGFWYP